MRLARLMGEIVVERRLPASAEAVFACVAKVERLPELVPHTKRVEFLSDQRQGVGTRFVETRIYGGEERETELEITEWVEPKRVRMVAQSHGTVWDTVFLVEPDGQGARLTVRMEARADKLVTRMRNKALTPMLRRGMERHLAAIEESLDA